jgi:hypothetical protein
MGSRPRPSSTSHSCSSYFGASPTSWPAISELSGGDDALAARAVAAVAEAAAEASSRGVAAYGPSKTTARLSVERSRYAVVVTAHAAASSPAAKQDKCLISGGERAELALRRLMSGMAGWLGLPLGLSL